MPFRLVSCGNLLYTRVRTPYNMRCTSVEDDAPKNAHHTASRTYSSSHTFEVARDAAKSIPTVVKLRFNSIRYCGSLSVQSALLIHFFPNAFPTARSEKLQSRLWVFFYRRILLTRKINKQMYPYNADNDRFWSRDRRPRIYGFAIIFCRPTRNRAVKYHCKRILPSNL